jgi:hypothetical protein
LRRSTEHSCWSGAGYFDFILFLEDIWAWPERQGRQVPLRSSAHAVLRAGAGGTITPCTRDRPCCWDPLLSSRCWPAPLPWRGNVCAGNFRDLRSWAGVDFRSDPRMFDGEPPASCARRGVSRRIVAKAEKVESNACLHFRSISGDRSLTHDATTDIPNCCMRVVG